MKKVLLVSLASLFTASMVQAAPAVVDGGVVHFTGDFVNAACAVSNDTAEQTVRLGQYRTARITAAGQYTNSIPFQIKLVDCDPAVAAKAKIAFSGMQDNTDNTLLRVNAGSASNAPAAVGVGVEINDSVGNILSPNGTTFSAEKSLVTGTNTMNFIARYKSTAAAVTPGVANADANFVISYE